MTFEHHARMQLGRQPTYELDSFTNGYGISDPGISESPLSEGHLQELAEEEMRRREFEQIAAAAQLEEENDLIEDL